MQPNFSAYPWDRVPKLSRRAAALQSTVARWIGARSQTASRLRKLLAPRDGTATITVRIVDTGAAFDPHAATAVVRLGAIDVHVLGASAGVRAIAQRLLGGPAELAAPRPLGVIENALWSLVVATALEDLGVPGHVWPILVGSENGVGHHFRIGLDVAIGDIALAVVLVLPVDIELRVPPARGDGTARGDAMGRGEMGVGHHFIDRVVFELPIVVGRCALHRDDLARLAPRQLVTLEAVAPARRVRNPGVLEAVMEIGGGAVGVTARTGELGATVTSGYVPRDMGLPDDAHVELSVGLGTTRMSLRQLTELSIGQVVPLGRPLAGPFEVRAQGRVLGRGELVDVDGELAVRIVSLGDQEL